MVLGDLGAEVIKVERPEGDDTRAWGPPWARRRRRAPTSSRSTATSAASRSTCATPGDLELARALVAARRRADRELPPRHDGAARARRGRDCGRRTRGWCRAASPASAREGAELPGYDLLIQAVGGLMSVTGEPDGPPTKVGVALVDVIAGLFATVAILAALRERERSGLGQRVEVSLFGVAARGARQPGLRLPRRRRRPRADGQPPSEHRAVRVLRRRRRRDRRGGRQRPPVRGALPRAGLRASSPSDARFATNPARVAQPRGAARRARAALRRRARAPTWPAALERGRRAVRPGQRRRRRVRARRAARPRIDRRDGRRRAPGRQPDRARRATPVRYRARRPALAPTTPTRCAPGCADATRQFAIE